MAVVAIAGPPAGIDRKLRQVGEPMSDLARIDSRRGATHQSAKRVQICRRRSLGDQVRVEELVMSDLIIGVVMDVVSHFILNNLQGLGIGLIACAAWDFVVLGCRRVRCIESKSRPRVFPEPLGSEVVPRLPLKDWNLSLQLGCCSTVLRRRFLLPGRSFYSRKNDG